ncbi:hypothetical protein B0A50_03488 [Salinomyces thailandicus]|uniref:Uncharacterized protein n=1 Tax=Salinomyces thailandicus TaxID=706561 RepID=A0A4U0U5N6_9PEZI|nr:hypothetical protein B0A50_03488 [Salinomyces thailandica]
MTATQADSEDDYQHWPDDESVLERPPSAAPGYDSHNGFRSHFYGPPAPKSVVSVASTKASSKASKISKASKAVTAKVATEDPSAAATPRILPYPHPYVNYSYPLYQPQQGFMAYPPMQQYPYAQPPATVSYGVPPYFNYPQQMMPQPAPEQQQQAMYQPAAYVYQPTYSAPQPVEWKGRTKAEVDEDNMKIAAKEDVYAKRKVQPVDVKEDQMFWVVELDGTHTLRSFMDVKELKGEWKKDPRYDDAYYFLREEEAAKEGKKD